MTSRTGLFALAALGGAAFLTIATPTPPALSAHALDQQPVQQQSQTEIATSLADPAKTYRLGLPNFTVQGGDAALADAARTVADVLWADLNFEHEFYMIGRDVSASIPVAATPDQLAYDRWSELGADFVLMGLVRPAAGGFEIELRMIGTRGTQARQQGFGQKYGPCTLTTPRACAHFIADDFHKQVRGLDGVAQTKLAFVSDRDSGRVTNRLMSNAGQAQEVYISDYDGANPHRITANRTLNLQPVWSPDGRFLLYTSYETQFPDIYIADLYGGTPRTRPGHGDEHARNYLGSWSPDGTKLAIVSTRSGNFDVWVVNRDGTGLHNLTNNPAADSAPTWSPSGAQIAFTSDRGGSNQLYVMNADGTGLVKLTSDQHVDKPTWSRLNYIAYATGAGPGHDIAVMDLSTRQVRILTNGIGSNDSPSVAPNGRHIAFVTTRWGRAQLAVIDFPTGNNLRRLDAPGDNSYPNWSPIRQR